MYEIIIILLVFNLDEGSILNLQALHVAVIGDRSLRAKGLLVVILLELGHVAKSFVLDFSFHPFFTKLNLSRFQTESCFNPPSQIVPPYPRIVFFSFFGFSDWAHFFFFSLHSDQYTPVCHPPIHPRTVNHPLPTQSPHHSFFIRRGIIELDLTVQNTTMTEPQHIN